MNRMNCLEIRVLEMGVLYTANGFSFLPWTFLVFSWLDYQNIFFCSLAFLTPSLHCLLVAVSAKL